MNTAKKPRRPTTKVLQRVWAWLDSHEMGVYGAAIDPETGVRYAANRDFTTPEEAIKVARHIDRGTVTEDEDDE